ncbi:methylenetetrahydrofolate reductase [Falsihalocynthiibacter arcticus]|uniref:5,10-methylenetetrahydrofolate reductase n=1 Tax=Falsihalocynthiibacter arcticus TaxID=1579316 RepID=A0A126V3K9_9RHOB|nr:methylenetetrahydrofolate reductase [Falsihalocynthiibacter arcticus]AML52737.1 5,10-methylenetetrahydrofolate reductase [Falsihalocynthiibacter arcticus]
MSLLSFKRRESGTQNIVPRNVTAMMEDYSIEVMPRTAEKVDDFRALLPQNTRVYVAHIEGTPIEEMVATAARLSRDGMQVMPHFPARIIQDRATLADWTARYQGEAGVEQGLILAGGVAKPHGDFHSSMQLLETGLFDGFKRLHIAGHPEGNRDIDTDGTDRLVMDALRWKQDFNERSDAQMAIVTQFAFEAAPVIKWIEALEAAGITIPVHLGVAGPAKLQTLIRFAIACGVGPSLRVLQKRARDVTKLVVPYEPTDLVKSLADYKAANPKSLLKSLHFFPLGGITTNANWALSHSNATPAHSDTAALAPQDP